MRGFRVVRVGVERVEGQEWRESTEGEGEGRSGKRNKVVIRGPMVEGVTCNRRESNVSQ